jgi:hypothetical protein
MVGDTTAGTAGARNLGPLLKGISLTSIVVWFMACSAAGPLPLPVPLPCRLTEPLPAYPAYPCSFLLSRHCWPFSPVPQRSRAAHACACWAGGYVITALLAGDARKDCANYPVGPGGRARRGVREAHVCVGGKGETRSRGDETGPGGPRRADWPSLASLPRSSSLALAKGRLPSHRLDGVCLRASLLAWP